MNASMFAGVARCAAAGDATPAGLLPDNAARRGFLKGGSALLAGAFVLGTHVPGTVRAAEGRAAPQGTIDPNLFVRIAPDGTVLVLSKHFDMGQGSPIGMATLVAEELDVPWSRVQVALAPNDAKAYANLFLGPMQLTGGSTAIANSWVQMRQVGAAARAMLLGAAAARWSVPVAELRTEAGVVVHPGSARRAGYGELAADAMHQPVPEPSSLKLKSPEQWTLIGQRLPRLDSMAKTTGRQTYASDIRRPGMVVATIARPHPFGATLSSFDATAAKAVPGVLDVLAVPAGVAVLARDTWSAIRGRKALKVVWSTAQAENRSTAQMLDEFRTLAAKPGVQAARRGDADAALGRDGARHVDLEFTMPYLAHAPMEPLNAVIERAADGGVDFWSGSQAPTIDQGVIAAVTKTDRAKIRIHVLSGGGSFGRRANLAPDLAGNAAMLLAATGGRFPIHIVWTREDDVRGGFYRPMALHRVKAAVDAQGRPSGWRHTVVTRSIAAGTPFEAVMIKDGVDSTAVEGVADTPYELPDLAVQQHLARSAVPVLWWRSVGHSHTAFAMESMIDALADAAGRDPVEFRMGLLAGKPRHRAALQLLADRVGWQPAPSSAQKGRPVGRGIALHESFGTRVAMMAEVRITGNDWRVERIVAAVDVGIPVNPDIVVAQVEGAVGFALSTLLRNEITFDDGQVRQSNYHDYEPTRIHEMPKVEVHIVRNDEAPSGIGEPGVPPLAPAVANALFAVTGKRLVSLPLRLA